MQTSIPRRCAGFISALGFDVTVMARFSVNCSRNDTRARWVVFKKFSIVFSLFLMVSHGLFWGIPDSWHENKIERLVTRHREYRDQSRSVRSVQIGSVHISHDMQRQCSSCRLEVRSILLQGFDQDRVQIGWRFTGCKICKWFVNGCKFLMFCFFQDVHGISRSQEP